MSNDGPGRSSIGDIAPTLAALTDDILYDQIWERPDLDKRDRSLVTVAALVALYRREELDLHLRTALQNGVTLDELVELITHLAFYTGWPNSVTALNRLRAILLEPTP